MLPALPPPLLPPAPSRPAPVGPPPTIVEDPACPCIDARHLFVDTTASSAVASEYRELSQSCQPGDILGFFWSSTGFSGNTGEGQYCYPASYGSEGCQAYDALLTGDHMCATDAPPSWCAKPWCFVDKETCRRSSADMFGTSLWGDLPVFWSHQTCVTEDVSDADLAYNADAAVIPGEGSGEVLQVGIPTMDYPLHFKRDAAGAIVLGVRRREASNLHTRCETGRQPRMRARQIVRPHPAAAPLTHTHTHTHTHTRRRRRTHARTPSPLTTPSSAHHTHAPCRVPCRAGHTQVEDALYFDDSVPWEGSMIDFMDAILEVAPYAGFNYTYTTLPSRVAFPDSKWTATVYDVQKRVIDMGGSDVRTRRDDWIHAQTPVPPTLSTCHGRFAPPCPRR